MQTTVVSALNSYFNKTDDGKTIKPISVFNQEIKALSEAEKLEMGTLAAAAMGNTIKTP